MDYLMRKWLLLVLYFIGLYCSATAPLNKDQGAQTDICYRYHEMNLSISALAIALAYHRRNQLLRATYQVFVLQLLLNQVTKGFNSSSAWMSHHRESVLTWDVFFWKAFWSYLHQWLECYIPRGMIFGEWLIGFHKGSLSGCPMLDKLMGSQYQFFAQKGDNCPDKHRNKWKYDVCVYDSPNA